MALVQHRLDGIEQRCARRAKSVLQCPVGGEQMTIQRTMPGARRTLVQRPDQVPAQAHAKLTACADQGSANASSRGNTLFCASTNPGARLRRYFASFAHSPTASDSMRCATPSINACTCSGRCSSPVSMSTHSSAPRSVSIAASNSSNRSMASAHSRRALDSSRLALRRRTLSCARILPNRPSASPSRSIAA